MEDYDGALAIWRQTSRRTVSAVGKDSREARYTARGVETKETWQTAFKKLV